MMWRRALWRVLLLLVWTLCTPRDSPAQAYCASGGEGWKPLAYQVLTVDTVTAQAIDLSAYPATATNIAMALVSVEDATVRFAFAVLPSAINGHEIAPGERFFLCGRALIEAFHVIRTSQGSANAHVRISLFQSF